jgi:hypothetical protein
MTRSSIFWGIDDYACEIVRHFVAALQDKDSWAAPYVVFEPENEDRIRAFHDAVVRLRESGGRQNISDAPRVLVFSAPFPFVPGAEEKLGLLEKISQTLQVTLPGSQSIILIVLFPPMTADKSEKVGSFKYFLRLEQMVWTIPFLNVVYVNQLSTSLYDNTTPEQVANDPIFECFSRELLDRDMDNIIQGLGSPAIRNRIEVLGRRCCYSTAGSYELIYTRKRCIEYLESRFRYELFQTAFLNDSSLSEDKTQLEIIQNRGDQFIRDEVQRIQPDIPSPPQVARNELEQLLDSEKIADKISNFRQGVLDATRRVSPEIEQVQKSMKEGIREEFLDFLCEAPGHLAGAKLYAEALQGRRLFAYAEENEKQPFGLKLFQELMCTHPLLRSVEELFEPNIKDAISRFDLSVPAKQSEDSAFTSLLEAMEQGKSKIWDLPPGIASHARFLFQSMEAILNHLTQTFIDFSGVTDLTNYLITSFGKECERLRAMIETNRKARREAEEEGNRLKKEYGSLRRIVRSDARQQYNEKEGERRSRLKNLDDEFVSSTQSFDRMRDFFVRLMNNAILPHTVRAMFNQTVKETVVSIGDEFDAFVSIIEKSLREKLDRAKIQDYTTATASSVLNRRVLNTLYQNILDKREMTDLAVKMLTFVPRLLSDAELEKLSYYKCRNLKDHYIRGSISLLDRMTHYASELFEPIRKLNILDVIELESEESAHQYLKETIEKTRKFLDFAPGFIPLVEQRGSMNSVLVVRTSQDVTEKLKSRYAFLFGQETRFIDNKNPDIIDITSLMFGFPAFLIHGLSECRELYHNAEGRESGDLWPESPS